MSPRTTSRKTKGTPEGTFWGTTGLQGIVGWIVTLISSLGILESSGISKITGLFQKYQSKLLSFLFDVKTTTVPWGIFVLGELGKKLNSWTRRSDGTLNRRLADLVEIKVPASEKPKDGISSKDVVIDEETNLWVRIYMPSEGSISLDSSHQFHTVCSRRPVMIYYHGGGFGVLCANLVNYDGLCRRMARACNMVVISVNYRKAPEHRYPTAYQDSLQVLQWLQSAESHGHLPLMADISQCFLAGDSAGGNIAHFMACRAAEREEELRQLRIRGVILVQPFFGSEQRTAAENTITRVPNISIDATDWHWKAFLPEGADRDHPACNVFGPNASDISELAFPPIIVVTGTTDFMIDHQTKYVSRMREMGNLIIVKNYVGGFHGFYLFVSFGTKIALECLADVKKFIDYYSDDNNVLPQGN